MIRHLFLLALSTCVLEPIANACNSYCGIGCSRYSLGKCRYCKAGWHGSYCQKKNVALHGNASQQGTYSTAYARRAVDGNTNNDYDKGSCTHSDERNNSWWSVQLGDNGVNQIKYMKIYNRKEPAANVWRRKGMEILIDGKRCKKWPDNVIPNITENVTCNETLTGHNLTITVRGQFFSLCEVQVFVCSDGWFGKDCDKRCNCRSLKDVCDKVTGRCPRGCQAGYTGVDCQTPCTAGRYGHGCSEKCGHCANNHVCDKTTGQCPSCVDGWRGKRCDLCRNGRYGHGCSEECGHCAKNDTCDMTNGHCPSCAAGWGGVKCNVCRDSIYGQDCSEECGHCANNQACDKLTGHCPSCADGWTGEKCDVCRDGRYGTDCASCGHCANNQACDKTTGHCLDTCDDGWQGNKCDACAKGTYGLNCNSSCSTGCSDTCDPANGSCSCKPGYSGHLCNNECSQAEGCTSLCGEGCKLGNCNTRDGTCGHPCKEGWKGTKCESRIIYCPAAVYNTTAGEFSLSRTAVGETFSTGTCHVDDKALVEVQCSPGRPREGNWSTFSTNKACDYSDLNHTDTSTKLRNALNGSKDGDIEKVIHLAANVTKNTTLNQLDLFLITDILEKAKNLSEVSSSVAEEVLTIYSAVINTSDSTLGDAQERARAPNRILRSVDEITGKIKPGPNGTARVSTDTFVSQVWDLTNPKVSENLPLGLSLSVSDDNQTSSTDSVFNQTLDHSKIDTAILLPSNFLKNIQNDSNGSDIRMSMNVYKDSLLFTKASVNDTKYQLNSKVVAAKIIVDGKEKTSLDGENVTMIFYSEKQDKGVVKECGYWNFTLIDWSTEGCNYSSGESGRDVCTCSHLTNFAVLTVHGGLGENSVHSLTLSVITILGLSLSIMGLSGTLLSFIVFKKLREKRPQQTLFNLALAELCAWLIFLVGITQTQSHAGCTLVAILLHYFLLASFLWMLAEAFLHYLLLVKVQAQGAFTDHYMLKTGIPAWGLPLLPVLIVLAVDPALYRGSDSYCWMSQSSALYAFALPVGLVILFNIIIYVLVVVRVVNMSRGRAQGTKRNKKRELLKIRVPVLCFILFGLSWIFGFLAVFEAKVVFQYLFCITSSTQGFLIFIFFTASNEEVRQLWHRLCCGKKQEHLVPDDRKDLSTSKVSTKTTDDIAETTTSI